MSRVRIKICGITRAQDALAAAALGVDAVGFVFYDKSPRYIAPMKAAAIIRRLPPFVTAVGLFVNPSQNEIDDVLSHCPLDVLQLHGDETPEFCEAQPRRVIKAVAVSCGRDLKQVHRYDCPVLLDAKAPAGVYGGSGRRIDVPVLRQAKHTHPLLLAGGLNPDNIAEMLAVRQWEAVDVSSGVEIMPGVKDAAKMRRFVAAVRRACAEDSGERAST